MNLLRKQVLDIQGHSGIMFHERKRGESGGLGEIEKDIGTMGRALGVDFDDLSLFSFCRIYF